jgi:hypothetical protein
MQHGVTSQKTSFHFICATHTSMVSSQLRASRQRSVPLCAKTHSKTVTSRRSNFVSRLMTPFADRSPSLYYPPKTHAIRGTSNGRVWNKFRNWIQLVGFWSLCDEWPAPYENYKRKGEIDPESFSNNTTTDIRTRKWKQYITPNYIRTYTDLYIKHLVLIQVALKHQNVITYKSQYYRMTLFVF